MLEELGLGWVKLVCVVHCNILHFIPYDSIFLDPAKNKDTCGLLFLKELESDTSNLQNGRSPGRYYVGVYGRVRSVIERFFGWVKKLRRLLCYAM